MAMGKNQKKYANLFRCRFRLGNLGYRFQPRCSQRFWQFEWRRRRGLHLVEFLAPENLFHFLLGKRLVFDERFGEEFQFFAFLGQNLGSTRATFFDKASDFGFDFLLGF
jgi:hypothetical protein